MPAYWSAKEERQYKHILASCKRSRSVKTCKRIAAATVNKRRSRCACPRGASKTKSGACKNRRTKRYVRKICRR